jgi:hypothetical protein
MARTKGEPGLEVLLLGGVHGDLPIEPSRRRSRR